MTTLWWHVYKGTCDHLRADVSTTYGQSTMSPEELAERPDLLTQTKRCGCTITYVESYTFEPDAEPA